MRRRTSPLRAVAGAFILGIVALLGGVSPVLAQVEQGRPAPYELLRARLNDVPVQGRSCTAPVEQTAGPLDGGEQRWRYLAFQSVVLRVVAAEVLDGKFESARALVGLLSHPDPTVTIVGILAFDALTFRRFEGQLRSLARDQLGEADVADAETVEYRIALPPGTYSLTVCYRTSSDIRDVVIHTFNDPDPVEVVDEDVTRDIVLPPLPETRRVAGAVSGLRDDYPFRFVSFTPLDTLVRGEAITMGGYQTRLLDGSYQVGFHQTSSDGSTRWVSLLGMVDVAGEDVGFNGTVAPAATLFGMVTINGRPTPGGLLTAVDTALTPADPNSCNLPFAAGGRTDITQGTGMYSLPLQTEVEYKVASAVFDESFVGSWTISSVVRMEQDVVLDIAYPAPPQAVNITGVVTAPNGEPVAGARVCAQSEELVDVPGSFTNCTNTNVRGNYTLRVFPGSNYLVVFTPPFQRF